MGDDRIDKDPVLVLVHNKLCELVYLQKRIAEQRGIDYSALEQPETQTQEQPGEKCEVKYKPPAPPAAPPGGAGGEAFLPPTTQLGALQAILTKLQSIDVAMQYTAPPAKDQLSTDQLAISVTTATKPSSPDIIAANGGAGYDQLLIYELLKRKSKKMWVINDGPDFLYVISSPDGHSWSNEWLLGVGESKIYNDVYELRLRSPTQGNYYRATEGEPRPSYFTTVAVNNTLTPPAAGGITVTSADSNIAPISINAAGDNTIIAAVSGKKHRIVKLVLACASAVDVILKSGANTLTGAMFLTALALDADFYPFDCNSGEAFVINLSSAVQTAGWVQYLEGT